MVTYKRVELEAKLRNDSRRRSESQRSESNRGEAASEQADESKKSKWGIVYGLLWGNG